VKTGIQKNQENQGVSQLDLKNQGVSQLDL